jgi:metallophosphoesterase superfamily enzyme
VLFIKNPYLPYNQLLDMEKTSIFWISDIHYLHDDKGSYKGYLAEKAKLIDAYFDQLKKKIFEESPTHIIISGDITFSGKEEQYEGFYNKVLKEFIEKNSECRIISAPGNHDVQRDIVLKITDKTRKDFSDFDSLPKKQKLLKELESKEFQGADVFQGSTINLEKSETIYSKLFLPKKGRINIRYGIFFNYCLFCETKILPRLKNLLDVDLYHYEDSLGLYGVIHDKKYNKIFVVMNSSVLAWGDTTYEKLFKLKKPVFSEYGTLAFDNEEIGNLRKVLRDFKENGVLQNNLVCGVCHHPFSWIDYNQRFQSGQQFSMLISQLDLLLFGHIHVQHFPGTIFRNRTLVFESPQLMDYHLYKFLEPDPILNATRTLGFNLLEVSANNRSLTNTQYQLLYGNVNGLENPFISEELKEIKFCKKSDNKIATYNFPEKKVSVSIFDYPLGDWEKVLANVSNKDQGEKSVLGRQLSISERYLIDLEGVFRLKKYIASEIPVNQSVGDDKFLIFLYDKEVLIVPNFLPLYHTVSFHQIIDFFERFLLSALLQLIQENPEIADLNIFFFDYMFHELSDEKIEVSELFDFFHVFTTKLRENIFRGLYSSENAPLERIKEMGMLFELILLKSYKNETIINE